MNKTRDNPVAQEAKPNFNTPCGQLQEALGQPNWAHHVVLIMYQTPLSQRQQHKEAHLIIFLLFTSIRITGSNY